MSPPGKKIGWTTCESVVTMSHRSPTRNAAPSSIAARPIAPGTASAAGPRRKTSSIRARIARPAAALLQRDPFLEARSMSAVAVVTESQLPPQSPAARRTGARSCSVPSRRDHAGADGRVGHALLAEELAVGRATRSRT